MIYPISWLGKQSHARQTAWFEWDAFMTSRPTNGDVTMAVKSKSWLSQGDAPPTCYKNQALERGFRQMNGRSLPFCARIPLFLSRIGSLWQKKGKFQFSLKQDLPRLPSLGLPLCKDSSHLTLKKFHPNFIAPVCPQRHTIHTNQQDIGICRKEPIKRNLKLSVVPKVPRHII